VVDDDAGVRESLRWLVESAGLRVETHASARAFLAGLDLKQPDCVVLDLRMPGMSGLQLQEELALRRYSHPIIIITGHGGPSVARDVLGRGAFAYVEKPFDDQQILDAISRALATDQYRRGARN
jgi:two-component system response regulator FixJ